MECQRLAPRNGSAANQKQTNNHSARQWTTQHEIQFSIC